MNFVKYEIWCYLWSDKRIGDAREQFPTFNIQKLTQKCVCVPWQPKRVVSQMLRNDIRNRIGVRIGQVNDRYSTVLGHGFEIGGADEGLIIRQVFING